MILDFIIHFVLCRPTFHVQPSGRLVNLTLQKHDTRALLTLEPMSGAYPSPRPAFELSYVLLLPHPAATSIGQNYRIYFVHLLSSMTVSNTRQIPSKIQYMPRLFQRNAFHHARFPPPDDMCFSVTCAR